MVHIDRTCPDIHILCLTSNYIHDLQEHQLKAHMPIFFQKKRLNNEAFSVSNVRAKTLYIDSRSGAGV